MRCKVHKMFCELLIIIQDILNQKNSITVNNFIGTQLKIILERRFR